MANNYEVGQGVRVSCAFVDQNGQPADPNAVSASILAPGANLGVALSVVKDSTGNYHADYTPAVPGIFRYKFVGSGGLSAVAEETFTAVESIS